MIWLAQFYVKIKIQINMKYFGVFPMHPINSTGPCLPTLAETYGSKSQWAFPMNLTIEDRKFTKMNVGGRAEYNDYLVATGPFINQDIPNNAIIKRISISVNVHSDTNRASEEVYWSFYGLMMGNSEPGTTKNCANFVTIISTHYDSENYTISSYTPEEWGYNTMTGAQIKDPSFGLAMRFRSTNQPAIVSMDFVAFTAVWTLPDEPN
jgi:hypothetical protein